MKRKNEIEATMDADVIELMCTTAAVSLAQQSNRLLSLPPSLRIAKALADSARLLGFAIVADELDHRKSIGAEWDNHTKKKKPRKSSKKR